MTLDELYKIIEERKKEKPQGSYVASLFDEGPARITQKVGEEAVEVVIAANQEKKDRVVSEMADLWFHCLVLLSALDIKPEEVYAELEKRRK
ncbi:MAG TPA: phosphoribosyl-ATP diphosphatase [Candidatus Saccharimonadales bacterium]|nr:phosphoribosyl-ATP diphosphatase [Candidatus Saccharimonadales bacterium]